MRVFMDRAFSPQTMMTIFVHEMQHVADKHSGAFAEGVIQDVNRQEGDVGNSYRSEFRAYWVGDHPSKNLGSPTVAARNDRPLTYGGWPLNLVRKVRTNFANERQEKIFWYMVDSGTYPWVRANYYFSPQFKQMVDRLTGLRGGNLINSVRIDNLRVYLEQIRKFHTQGSQERSKAGAASQLESAQTWIDYVVEEAPALTKADRQFLRSDAARPFWTFFNSCFPPPPILGGKGAKRMAKLRERLQGAILFA